MRDNDSMTREEFEKVAIKKMREIYEAYLEYNPDAVDYCYISMCMIKQGDESMYMNVNNDYTSKDKKHPVNAHKIGRKFYQV